MKYIIRVTRNPDGETADIDVEADDWKAAKMEAVRIAKENPEYFDDLATFTYYVAPMDDDEEASREDEQ